MPNALELKLPKLEKGYYYGWPKLGAPGKPCIIHIHESTMVLCTGEVWARYGLCWDGKFGREAEVCRECETIYITEAVLGGGKQ